MVVRVVLGVLVREAAVGLPPYQDQERPFRSAEGVLFALAFHRPLAQVGQLGQIRHPCASFDSFNRFARFWPHFSDLAAFRSHRSRFLPRAVPAFGRAGEAPALQVKKPTIQSVLRGVLPS